MECCKNKDEKIKVLELLLNDLKEENEKYKQFILSCISDDEIEELASELKIEIKEKENKISLVN
jgi:hypothetical protein